jgi:diphosphomevalonate decarboxylase
VISGSAKEISSTQGHKAMEVHPFLHGREKQAGHNIAETLEALRSGDFERLALVAENEALTLHALMMSASPGTILMKPATVEAIGRVRNARRNGLPLFFTLDAGANLHLLYPASADSLINPFIETELKPLCENGQVIFDRCGGGPEALDEGTTL